ncbi:hypothetical protein DDE18_15250 [Nocardioides gansuensis]|uniref:DUF4115 domain-containing protein n=1 Tax=Nocardioides gansuensis TaxID=2138300 RepID=A0A2T8F8M7_9ACTN|nr:helix-turn-helix domain-containing protein [Nocardioides gansuensis]PVG82040.1 hypothetical protein DDE18_15250 [Nocardioides gansuensis]
MESAPLHDQPHEEQETPREALTLAPDVVEVHRSAGLAAGVGAVSSAVAIAYLGRAVQTGAVLDWVLSAAMGLLGIAWLAALVDARTPLMVADAQGVRMRLGRTWRGLPWGAVRRVEHTPRRGLLIDGRLVVVPHNPERLLDELDRRGRRQAAWAERLHGAPLAVPLGLSTKVTGAGDDISAALERVAMSATEVVVVERAATTPAPETTEVAEDVSDDTGADHVDTGHHVHLRDPRPLLATGIARLAALLPERRDGVDDHAAAQDEVADEAGTGGGDGHDVAASATPAPFRETRPASRAEVRREAEAAEEPTGRELRRPGSVSLVEETQVWGDRVRPIAREGDAVEALVIDDFAVEPADDPVIGPELAAARTRIGLTVDQLAERTRIRPHVIEAIEVDDFVPCGGDFYARGHLRTLARVLGVDVTPLLASYDERYAHAPINPRRVFEAELATGAHGSIRGTRGGPNWSALVAVVMALVLCWSIARLVMDSPQPLRGATPVLNGSGGPDGMGTAPVADPVPVVVSAPAGGAHVVVRDGRGEIVFKGNLSVGATQELTASPPVRVQSTDGAVTVALDGEAARPVGEPGVTGQGTFVPR